MVFHGLDVMGGIGKNAAIRSNYGYPRSAL